MLAATTVSRIEEYLIGHPVSDDPKACRRAWVVASYKLTHDPNYESYLKIDWFSFVRASVPLDEDSDDFPELDDVGVPEKRFSFPWLFPDELFALLR